MKNLLLTLSLLLLAITTLPSAQSAEFEVDRDHSTVGFRIRHLVSKVTGRFNDFTGTIQYDKNKIKDVKFQAAIDAKSINTDNQKRDEHLRSPDFFDAEKFPKLEFVSTSVEPKGKDKAKVKGKMTMKGVTKDVSLDVEFLGESVDPWGTPRMGLSATGSLNRKDFGISWNKALDKGGVMLGDDVELRIEVESKLKSPPAQKPTAPAKKEDKKS